jgi:bifunctional ADP-heptose synthase (sugar kinase/adenylyltransferase)
MAALQCVGAVIVFDEDTPLELIQAVKPDVLVKGADYKIEDIVGAKEVLAAGGEVKTLEFLPGFSTSNIEKKILEANRNL